MLRIVLPEAMLCDLLLSDQLLLRWLPVLPVQLLRA
jgi:hypothetical protein